MEHKLSSKYYIAGAVLLILVIVVVTMSLGGTKSAGPTTESVNDVTAAAPSVPTTPSVPPSSNTVTPVVDSTPTSTSNNGLLGTWTSSVKGKGMQGSGDVTLQGTVDHVTLTGDVDLVVKKVENNTSTGTITFTNFCFVTTVSAAGKPDVTNPTQCLRAYSQPAVMQITGHTIQYTGESVLGAAISLTGTYTRDSMSGTFTRTSSSGTIKGTFDLTHSKK